MIAHLCI